MRGIGLRALALVPLALGFADAGSDAQPDTSEQVLIRGTVVDEAGAPIERAKVAVYGYGDGATEYYLEKTPPLETTSDASGEYGIYIPKPALAIVVASAPGYAVQARPVRTSGVLPRTDFRLSRGVTLGLRLENCRWPWVVISDEDEIYRRARFSSDCRATFENVNPGRTLVWQARDPRQRQKIGSIHVVSVPPEVTAEVSISAWGTSIHGRLLRDGVPLAGKTIAAESVEELPVGLIATTSARGEFEFWELEPGTWRLWEEHAGRSAGTSVTLSAGEEVQLTLHVTEGAEEE